MHINTNEFPKKLQRGKIQEVNDGNTHKGESRLDRQA